MSFIYHKIIKYITFNNKIKKFDNKGKGKILKWNGVILSFERYKMEEKGLILLWVYAFFNKLCIWWKKRKNIKVSKKEEKAFETKNVVK